MNIFRFLSTMSFEKLKHYCVSQGSVIFPEFGKLFVNVLWQHGGRRSFNGVGNGDVIIKKQPFYGNNRMKESGNLNL